MAKKVTSKTMQGILTQKHEPAQQRQESPRTTDARRSTDKRVPASVGLKQSELDELQTIANENNTSRNGVMAYFVRYALKDYRAGKLKLKLRQVTRNVIEQP